MTQTYNEILNKIRWDPKLDPKDFIIAYEHHSGKYDFKVVKASEIDHVGKKFIYIGETTIPYHRIKMIQNIKTREVLAGKNIGIDLCDLESSEITGKPFEKVKPREEPEARKGKGREISVSVRVSYPEDGEYDWHKALAEYSDIGSVEVAFHKVGLFLEKVQIREVLAPFSALPIKASSIHMAHAKITKPETFVSVLEKTARIAEALECNLIVVHPSYGSLRGRIPEVNAFFAQRIDPLLEAANSSLCWETFSGKRRFLSGIEGIAAFCEGRQWHRACYDTSHLHKPQRDVITDIQSYAPIIKCFHLSNRTQDGKEQHLTLRHPDGVLDFEQIVRAIIESGFLGPLTLEYLREYHDRLLKDAQWLKGQLENVT